MIHHICDLKGLKYSEKGVEVMATDWSLEMSYLSLHTSNDCTALEHDGSLSESAAALQHAAIFPREPVDRVHAFRIIELSVAYEQSLTTNLQWTRRDRLSRKPATRRSGGSTESGGPFWDITAHEQRCHFCRRSYFAHISIHGGHRWKRFSTMFRVFLTFRSPETSPSDDRTLACPWWRVVFPKSLAFIRRARADRKVKDFKSLYFIPRLVADGDRDINQSHRTDCQTCFWLLRRDGKLTASKMRFRLPRAFFLHDVYLSHERWISNRIKRSLDADQTLVSGSGWGVYLR